MSYYAEFRYYGARTNSRLDSLAIFETKEARDEWCNRINGRDTYNLAWFPVTTRDARRRYSFQDFNDGDKAEELNGERDMNGNPVFCISPKRSFLESL